MNTKFLITADSNRSALLKKEDYTLLYSQWRCHNCRVMQGNGFEYSYRNEIGRRITR